MKKYLPIFPVALGLIVACGLATADQRDGPVEPEATELETFPLGSDETADDEDVSAGIMRVESLEPGLQRAGGPFPRAAATIRVVDADGKPVRGATVFGRFSGDVGRRPFDTSGVTDANGTATLKTKMLGTAQPVFTFRILDISHPELIYEQ